MKSTYVFGQLLTACELFVAERAITQSLFHFGVVGMSAEITVFDSGDELAQFQLTRTVQSQNSHHRLCRSWEYERSYRDHS